MTDAKLDWTDIVLDTTAAFSFEDGSTALLKFGDIDQVHGFFVSLIAECPAAHALLDEYGIEVFDVDGKPVWPKP